MVSSEVVGLIIIALGVVVLTLNYAIWLIYHSLSFYAPDELNTFMNILHGILITIGLATIGFGVAGWRFSLFLGLLFPIGKLLSIIREKI